MTINVDVSISNVTIYSKWLKSYRNDRLSLVMRLDWGEEKTFTTTSESIKINKDKDSCQIWKYLREFS